jgi:hypothetical protein
MHRSTTGYSAVAAAQIAFIGNGQSANKRCALSEDLMIDYVFDSKK